MNLNRKLKWGTTFLAVCIILSSCSTSKEGKKPPVSADISEIDLSTDDGVIKELSRIHNKEFTKDYVCIQRPKNFPDLILVAMFAHDRGCKGNEAFFKGEFGGISDRSSAIIQHAGWKQTDKREQLAKSWFNWVHCAWRSPITSKPEEFPDSLWFEQEIKQENGSTIVRGWIQEPSGMRPEAVYQAEEIRINNLGEIESVERVGEFIHPY